MRLRLATAVVLLATTLNATTWTLTRPDEVGGKATRVLGAPRAEAEGGLVFDGAHDGVLVPDNPLAGLAAFTVEVLFRPDADGPPEQRFLHAQDEAGARMLFETRLLPGNQWALDTFLLSGPNNRPLLDRTKTHPVGKWTWVALTYADGVMRSYVNGHPELEGSITFPPMKPGTTSIGVRQNLVYWFKGAIREIRVHPRALPASELQAHD